MFSIFWWIIWVALNSIAIWNFKKAMNNTSLTTWMFKFFVYIFWIINILVLLYYFWFEFKILTNYKYLLLILLIAIFWIFSSFLHYYVLKRVKLSEVLPYENLDKLFIIIFWFFLFHWTNNWSSLTTLLISIFTLIIIILFTIDLKNIKIPRYLWLLTFYKILRTLVVLSIWYFLTIYESSTFITTIWTYEFILYCIIIIITKDSLKSIFTQNKPFYINRITAVFCWMTSSIIWVFIIKELWVIVWTLFWFLWIASTILAMKWILNDTPTKKQISLAFLVIFLIWIWYYFK